MAEGENSEKAASRRRLSALDGLRGWAAAAVILFHCVIFFDQEFATLAMTEPAQNLNAHNLALKFVLTVLSGETAVVIFFAISGFVLHRSLRRNVSLSWREALTFCWRRTFRLMPALIVATIVSFGAGVLVAGAPADVPKLVQNSLLIRTDQLGVSWTLRVEMLAVPAILLAALLMGWMGVAGGALVVAFAIMARQSPALVFGLADLSVALIPIMAGMLLAAPGVEEAVRRVANPWAGAIVLAAVIFAKFFVYQGHMSAAIAQGILAAALVGVLAYSPGDNLHGYLSNRLSVFMGRISYSLYLFGSVVGSYLAWYPRVIFGIPSGLQIGLGLFTGVVVILVTVPVAVLSERFVEMPGIRVGNSLLKRFRSGADAARAIRRDETGQAVTEHLAKIVPSPLPGAQP